jgi:hypothetical protein
MHWGVFVVLGVFVLSVILVIAYAFWKGYKSLISSPEEENTSSWREEIDEALAD